MRRTGFAILIVALLALSVAASGQTQPDNEAYFRALLGWDEDTTGTAMIRSALGDEPVSYAQAVARLVERAGPVDLQAVTADAGPGANNVGDVWVFGSGPGPCQDVPVYHPVPMPGLPIHPQLWTYAGGAGTVDDHSSGVVIAWTTKTVGTYTTEVRIVGQSDFFCVEFNGMHLFFPFLDGLAVAE